MLRLSWLLLLPAGGCSISTAGELDRDGGAGSDARRMDVVRPPEDGGPGDAGTGEDRVVLCAIGFADCDAEPGCETSTQTDPVNCGGCGAICAFPTPACIAGTCAACSGPAECGDDGLTCTIAACRAMTCVHDIADGRCLIGGVCYADGDRNPANDCEACRPGTDATDWTATAGRSCDDGRACTDPDTCTATGACQGPPATCDDTLTCTNDSCDEDAGGCVFDPMPGICVIGRQCYTDGTADPDSSGCRFCDANRDRAGWTRAANGTDCGCAAICCAGACVTNDEAHCGGCGVACPARMNCTCSSCSLGSCRCG